MVEAVRKVNLGRALGQLRNLFPDEYNFHPRSWFLPQQYTDFVRATGGSTVAAVSPSAGADSIPYGVNNRASRCSDVIAPSVDNSGTLQRLQGQGHGGDRSDRKSSSNSIAQDVNGNRPVFIVKPDEGSQGEGIYLIQASDRSSSTQIDITITLIWHDTKPAEQSDAK